MGDQIKITDGFGNLITAKIIDADFKRCGFEVIQSEKTEKTAPPLHIAIAPTKNIDRFEFFLEKCTEIGISEITPIICFHSERKTIKVERLNKIIVSACKQSKNFHFPIFNELSSLTEIINSGYKRKFIAHCDNNENCSLPMEEKEIQQLLDTIESRIDSLAKRQTEIEDIIGFNKVLSAYISERDTYSEHLSKMKELIIRFGSNDESLQYGVDPDFPESLLQDEELKSIATLGEEYGNTTGRPRIANWLNMNKLVKAVNQSGTTMVIMSKGDVLEAVGVYRVFSVYAQKMISFPNMVSESKDEISFLPSQ